MEISALRIFTAVVQQGGVTRAAEHLHRVQSNVTTRIRQLEEELGLPLFVRAGKRMHLTPAGQTLLDYADRILGLVEEAQIAVQDSTPRGTLRLGCMESTAAVRLPAPLSRYAKRYPEVEFELRTGNPTQLSTAVLAGEIDAALVAEPVAKAKFDSRVVFEEEPIIVSSRDRPAIDSGITTPKTILVFEHGCPHRQRLEDWYAERHEMPERTIELGSYHAMLGCVTAGMGAALIPASVLATFPERMRLRVHKLPRSKYRLRTLLIWRKGFKSPNVDALAAILRPQS